MTLYYPALTVVLFSRNPFMLINLIMLITFPSFDNSNSARQYYSVTDTSDYPLFMRLDEHALAVGSRDTEDTWLDASKGTWQRMER